MPPNKRVQSGQIIRLEKLRFAWNGHSAPLLNIANFDVDRSERLFVRGASGSGKSTLLGLIAGVIASQSGVIEVLGQPLDAKSAATSDRFRADHFGIIFQQFNLIPYLSVIENVTLACEFSDARRRKAIARKFGLFIEMNLLTPNLVYVVLLVMLIGFLIGLIPGIRMYRYSLIDGMAIII
ncbi:MAG: ATP-binding cassette domain-containing protein [bacterium]